jgi:hypothetical protein
MSRFIFECSFHLVDGYPGPGFLLAAILTSFLALGWSHRPTLQNKLLTVPVGQVANLPIRRQVGNLSYQLPVTMLCRLNYADYKPKPRGCQERDERPKACPEQSEGTNDEGN